MFESFFVGKMYFILMIHMGRFEIVVTTNSYFPKPKYFYFYANILEFVKQKTECNATLCKWRCYVSLEQHCLAFIIRLFTGRSVCIYALVLTEPQSCGVSSINVTSLLFTEGISKRSKLNFRINR